MSEQCQQPQAHPNRCGCAPAETEQVSSVWLAQLRAEYRQFGEEVERLRGVVAKKDADIESWIGAHRITLQELHAAELRIAEAGREVDRLQTELEGERDAARDGNADYLELQSECQGLRAQLAAQQAAVPEGWNLAADQLPGSGRAVLAFYLNSHGKGRRIRAEHIARWTVQAEGLDPDPGTECVEYSEQDDAYYILEGWYELIDNWDDYSRIAVNEGVVTHWMEMPTSPAAPQQVPVTPEAEGSAAQKSFWAGFEAAHLSKSTNIRQAWNHYKASDEFARLNPDPSAQGEKP